MLTCLPSSQPMRPVCTRSARARACASSGAGADAAWAAAPAPAAPTAAAAATFPPVAFFLAAGFLAWALVPDLALATVWCAAALGAVLAEAAKASMGASKRVEAIRRFIRSPAKRALSLTIGLCWRKSTLLRQPAAHIVGQSECRLLRALQHMPVIAVTGPIVQ